jgi:ribose transport system permease protein
MNQKEAGTQAFSNNQKQGNLKMFLLKNNCIIILVALIIISSILSPHFFSLANFFNLTRQYSLYMIMAIGMLFVLISGGIDLSMGSIVGVSGMVVAIALTNWGWGAENAWGLIPVVVLALVIGLVFGCINGFFVAYANMMPFIVTLATQIIGRGIAYMVTKGTPLRIVKSSAASEFLMRFTSDGAPLIGVPWIGIFALVIIIIFAFILKYTKFGRLCTATGSNASAVRFAGINVRKYRFLPYLLAGVMGALAGIILTGRAGTGTVDGGTGYEFDVIAGCIIGGASLEGGRGTVIYAVIGMITLALITNILNLLSMGSSMQKIIRGCIIIVAVLMSNMINKRRDSTA